MNPRELPAGARRERVYAGDLLVFTGVETIKELCRYTDGPIHEALGPSDPVEAQFALDR